MGSKNTKLKVLGINSGLGVALFPFKKGFEIIGNFETRGLFHDKGNNQWNMNFPGVPLWKKYSKEYAQLEPDIIVSSPDCGAGSMLRLSRSKEFGDNKQNKSLGSFFFGIEIFKPKFFLFENLPTLFNSFPKDQFEEILRDYNLIERVESMDKWGNSQYTRKRLVIYGIRKDMPLKKIQKYFKLPQVDGIKTCHELYGDIDSKNTALTGIVRESLDAKVCIHGGKRLSYREVRLNWRKMKNSKSYLVEGRNFKTAPGVYRNLNNEYPRTARKSERQFLENGLNLTPRHLARVMGVPDDFEIYIDPFNQDYHIRKARTVLTKGMVYQVPAHFAKAVGKAWSKLL